MAKVRLKRSSVQGKAPSNTDLDVGELGVNTYDGRIFLKRSGGAEVIFDISRSPYYQNVCDHPWNADPTGQVDCTAVVQAAFNAGITRFPAGTFLLSSSITTNPDYYTKVKGDGFGRTILKFTSGGLVIPVANFSRLHRVEVSDLTVMTTAADPTSIGIRIYNSGYPIESSVYLKNIEVCGGDGFHGTSDTQGNLQWWGTLLSLEGMRFIDAHALKLCGGAPGKTVTGIQIKNSNTPDAPIGLEYLFNQIMITGVTNGINLTGWTEGFYMSNFEVYGVRNGIIGSHPGGPVVGTFLLDNGHINVSRQCIGLTGINNLSFINLSLNRGIAERAITTLSQPANSSGNTTEGYWFENQPFISINSGTVDGEIFIADNRMFTNWAQPGWIVITGTSRFMIHDNIFYNNATTTNGISVTGATGQGLIHHNTFDGVVTNLINLTGATGTDIQVDHVNGTNYTSKIVDPSDLLGKHISMAEGYLTNTVNGATGNGDLAVVAPLTLRYNYGSIMDPGNGFVTTKVKGWYQFNASVTYNGITSAHTNAVLIFSVGGGVGNHNVQSNPFGAGNGNTVTVNAVSPVLLLEAGVTVQLILIVYGGTKTINIIGADNNTTWSASLIREF